MVLELGGHFNFCSVICFFHLFYFSFSFLKTIVTSTSSTHSRYFNFNTTINTLNCFCAFFQKLYQSAMTLDRTWTKRLNYFGNTPFLSLYPSPLNEKSANPCKMGVSSICLHDICTENALF